MNNAVSVPESNFMRIDEASRYTGIIKSRLYKMAMPKARKITTYKVGGNLFFDRKDLDKLMADSRRSSQAEIEAQAFRHIRKQNNRNNH